MKAFSHVKVASAPYQWPTAEFIAAPTWCRPDLGDDPLFRSATTRIRAAAFPESGPAQAWPVLDDVDAWALATTQKALAFPVAKATFRALWASADARQRTRLQAQSAPGSAAWLQLQPCEGSALTDGQFAITLALRLGVPVLREDPGACRPCTLARDAWGVRYRSCTVGGDIALRHSAVRDLVCEMARRADVDPILERAGILLDPSLRTELRRPADVLVHMARQGARGAPALDPSVRLALDIKVINAEGVDHAATGWRPDAQGAMARFAAQAAARNNTAELCLAHGVTYTPIVFTAHHGRDPQAAGCAH